LLRRFAARNDEGLQNRSALMFSKILIANRGEIACRIIRTARRLGIRTVAVYSDADAKAMHVAMADEALRIGAPPPRESYLSIARVIEAARASGAQAIHPGYGFLSENAEFAEACAAGGIVFIGPSAGAIRAIGDKAAAKTIMQRAGIPTVPGYHGAAQDAARFAAEAERIGYPLLIKAAAGGGGRGMRLLPGAAELAAALDSARREAEQAFGNGALILEKYLARARHIEVQVFGDAHGAIVHLFERDCSAQRRHQKVIEEAPAPRLSAALRSALAAAAIAAGRAVQYTGAGTVEFILQDDKFYFIEMNTRLQVEHPVTEMITGHDLVEWQIRIASGEPLPAAQAQISSRGHAIEARLYAEDPGRDFAPASGPLQRLRLPEPASDLRIETGVREGDDIPIYYDALLAKIVAYGAEREQARRRLEMALAEIEIAGIAHNRDFLLRLLRHRDFVAGAIDTGSIERHRAALVLPLKAAPVAAIVAATLAWLYPADDDAAEGGQDAHSPWKARDGWRLSGESASDYALAWAETWSDGGIERKVAMRFGPAGLRLTIEETIVEAKLLGREGMRLAFTCDGAPFEAGIERRGNELRLALNGGSWRLRAVDPLARAAGAQIDPARLVAPVHGRVLDVLVSAGMKVRRGQPLILLECMKLEYRVTAPVDGRVEALHYAAGDVVEEGALLLKFVPDPGISNQ
jgi:3-methylcrotonyl-CoA carboxylase alpha subunit